MKCPHCNSEWKTDENISASLTSCPFCKKSLAEREEPKSYDNSKDALVAIMKQFGAEVLLGGNLKAFFSDIAPSVSDNIKRLVYDVYAKGAAQILKRNLTASETDKEIAVRVAVKQLTESFIVPEMAETVIYEFAAALGWQVGRPVPAPKAPEPQAAVTPKPAIPRPQSHPVKPPISNGIKIAPKIGGTIPFGSYNWRVLDVQGDRALIITEDIIEKRPYDGKWETSTLRQKYLNGEFLQKFTREQQGRIIEREIHNRGNLWYGTKGGGITYDKIFLLSLEEADRYFGDSGDYENKRRKTYNNGKYIAASEGCLFSNAHDNERKARYGNKAWLWWLRSPGCSASRATGVDSVGVVGVSGDIVDGFHGGVRPALWLKL